MTNPIPSPQDAAGQQEPAAWRIEYDNDVGPDDGGFWEWWTVTDGTKSFKCDSKPEAEWLCAKLNATPTAGIPLEGVRAGDPPPWALVRGAEFLEWYACFIKEAKPDDLERHPYLPELEEVAEELRALAAPSAAASTPQAQQAKDVGDAAAGLKWTRMEDGIPPMGVECIVLLRPLRGNVEPFYVLDTWNTQREAPVSFSSATIEVGDCWDSNDVDDVIAWAIRPSFDESAADAPKASSHEASPPVLADERLGDVESWEQGKPDSIDRAMAYEAGSWFKAESVDEMQRFYRARLPAIREAARDHGYAIGVHGSERRDFDLIACAWRDGASDADTLAHAIATAACGITREGAYQWTTKPLGRVAVSIPVCWTHRRGVTNDGHIDLSVAPAALSTPPAIPDALHSAIEQVLLHHRGPWVDEDGDLLPLVDVLTPAGDRDITAGAHQVRLICDAIYNDPGVRAALSNSAAVGVPVAWTLRKTLEARETTTTAYLWFVDPQNCGWAPLYATPQLPVLSNEPTIKWTLNGDKTCDYTNWLGETPFGRILITWKGWKDDKDASVDEFPGGFTCYGEPDDVKRRCDEEFASRVRAVLAAAVKPHP